MRGATSVPKWPFAIILAIAFVSVLVCQKKVTNNAGTGQYSPPAVIVRFGMLPYGDHTYAIIGAENGWFRDVGIDLRYKPIKVEEIVPLLGAGTLDVVSCPPGILFASYDNSPNLVSFVFGDLFQGYAVMASPKAGVKSYSDFLSRGLSRDEAMVATVRQMKGKVFAYPSEAAIKPFIDLVVEKGGISRSDFKSLVLDDPLTVNAMRDGRADFQVGGVPSRLILQREGFRPMLSAIDIAIGAKPSPDSIELAGVLQNGWATTKEYYEKRHDTILRMAGVNYRIMKFINTYPDRAIAIHMPYLSQISGTPFSVEEGKIIYNDLNPFFDYKKQRPWFYNPKDSLYYKNVNGAILNSFIGQGIYKGRGPGVEDIIYADDVYRELENLRVRADSALKSPQRKDAKQPAIQRQWSQVESYYREYAFLDASRLADKLLNHK